MSRKKQTNNLIPMKIYSIDAEQKEQLINNVMADFDFERVQKVMSLLNWKYHNGVPTVFELKKFAQSLLESVLRAPQKYDSVYSGGFFVQFDRLAHTLSMQFIITESQHTVEYKFK